MLDAGVNGDWENKKYWKNPGGVFTQYYVRSLLDIGIIGSIKDANDMPTLLYKPMSVGIDLAASFEESVTKDEADKFLYTKFIKTVSEKLHMHGKEISVDITVNSNSPNWSLCYDRKGMAAYVDYEVIMGYDQTPGGSRYSGPVSSYSWLKHHIAMLLKQVPNNKLVLGLPFYTRIWTGKEGQAASSVLMMKQIKSLLGQNNIGLFWNPEDRQYVGCLLYTSPSPRD